MIIIGISNDQPPVKSDGEISLKRQNHIDNIGSDRNSMVYNDRLVRAPPLPVGIAHLVSTPNERLI